jgi:hypothetical protein
MKIMNTRILRGKISKLIGAKKNHGQIVEGFHYSKRITTISLQNKESTIDNTLSYNRRKNTLSLIKGKTLFRRNLTFSL